MLQLAEKKRVTKSIGELGRRVTAADVSTKTGLPVLVVSQALNQIAAETDGHIAVSQSGDVVYSFRPGFANRYLTKGVQQLIERVGERFFKVLFFLLKISFGIMLILSFFIIVITIFILFYADRSQSGRGKNSSQTEETNRFSFLDYLILQDVFKYFLQPASPVKYVYDKPTVRRREHPNFLLDCFSFLFGDGDPNEGIEEKKWQLIAQVIKKHDYVITAEQLAPYTGADPHREDAVLPVLVRFDGKPEVTESGNIVYRFESLAVTSGTDLHENIPDHLHEFYWKFTEVEPAAMRPVYFIAGLNFAGAWFLYILLHSSKAASITVLFTTLVVYATLFLVVPMLRNLSINFINQAIDKRNNARERNADALESPDAGLKKKLAEAREFRVRDHLISKKNVVYTTEKNSLEQDDDLSRKFAAGEVFDAKPEETFDASPTD